MHKESCMLDGEGLINLEPSMNGALTSLMIFNTQAMDKVDSL